MSVRAPDLAVVLVTDRFETIREVVARLRAQTARERIELVLVGPARGAVEPGPGEDDGLARVAVVEHPVLPLQAAKAAGVRAASAPVVYFCETHTYPEPGFAEAILNAHARGIDGVAPAVGNANPEDGALSWSALVMDYGARLVGNPAGELDSLDAYNASYRRDLLLACGEGLADALKPASGLDRALRRRGHRLRLEPAARIDHLNVSRLGPWIAERFLGGRLLAQSRVARWSTRRRLLYLLGSPLVPLVRIARLRRAARLPGVPRTTLPLVAVGAVLWGLGELVGYAGGGRAAELAMAKYELNKGDYVSRAAA